MVDLLEMRLYILKALSLIIELPPTFLSHVSDRLACGMSIIIFHSYSHLKEVNEWVTIDLLDCYAQYQGSGDLLTYPSRGAHKKVTNSRQET